MYRYLYDPLPDLDAYLERIHIKAPTTLDKDNLDAMIFSHQCNIPFENLDVFDLQMPISLGTQELFHKIVTSHRGGYCFELNGLFEKLLSECGYRAYSCLSRVIRGKDFIPPSLHRVVLVEIDQMIYFCDVGYGGPMPAASIPLIDGIEVTIQGDTFCLSHNDQYWWTLSRYSHGSLINLLQFYTMPQDPVDFLAPNYYCWGNESSFFRTTRVVNLRSENGSRSITNNQFSITTDGIRTETTISSVEERLKLLKQHFGIILPFNNTISI